MSNNKLIINLSLLIILIMMFCRTWLPGAKFVGEKALYIILIIGTAIIFLKFDFNKLLNINVALSKEKILIITLALLFFYSTIFYNEQEFLNLEYLIRLLCFGIYIIIYFYLIPVMLIENPDLFKAFIKYISNFGLFTAVIGFILVFLGVTPIGEKSQGALISFIYHPNNTSIVFTVTIFASIYLFYSQRINFPSFKKKYYIISIIIQSLAQLFTYTRAGLMATFLGFSIFFIFIYRKKFVFILSAMVISIPVFIVGFITAKGFGSFLSRLYLLVPIYGMVTESNYRLLWGYGATHSHVVFQYYRYAFNVLEDNILDPHNTYASLIIMFGVLFTSVLLIFVITLLINGFIKILSKKVKDKLYFVFLVCAIITICLQGCFDSELIKPEFYIMQYLLLILGLLYHCTVGSKKYVFIKTS